MSLVAQKLSVLLDFSYHTYTTLMARWFPGAQAKLGSGIKNIDAAAAEALTFDLDHPVYIPSKVGTLSNSYGYSIVAAATLHHIFIVARRSKHRQLLNSKFQHSLPNVANMLSQDAAVVLQDKAVRSYVKTDASLTRWQEGMSALYKQIVDTTPVGEISDSSMEFKFDGDSRRYMKSEHSNPSLVSVFISVTSINQQHLLTH